MGEVEGGEYFFGALRPIVVGVRRVAGEWIGRVRYSCAAGRIFGGRIFGGIAEVVGTECRNLGGGLANVGG